MESRNFHCYWSVSMLYIPVNALHTDYTFNQFDLFTEVYQNFDVMHAYLATGLYKND